MTHHIRCDICGREAGTQNYLALRLSEEGEVTTGMYGYDTTWHICTASSGGDFGCLGFVKKTLKDAGEAAKAHRTKAEQERRERWAKP